MQSEENSQVQTPTLDELPGEKDFPLSLDEEEEHGPSGLARQKAPARLAASTVTTLTSATNTQLTATTTDAPSTTGNNIIMAAHSNLELTDTNSVNEERRSASAVQAKTGSACGGRGGGRGGVEPRHHTAGATDAQANLPQVIEAYEGYQGAMGQVSERLRNIELLQASHD